MKSKVQQMTVIITSKADVLTFGKHRGESIRQILRTDPSYILWMYENDVAQIPEDIVIEAEEADDSKGGDHWGHGDNWGLDFGRDD